MTAVKGIKEKYTLCATVEPGTNVFDTTQIAIQRRAKIFNAVEYCINAFVANNRVLPTRIILNGSDLSDFRDALLTIAEDEDKNHIDPDARIVSNKPGRYASSFTFQGMSVETGCKIQTMMMRLEYWEDEVNKPDESDNYE